jgi:capsular exopolysaccharide synthesis family protein
VAFPSNAAVTKELPPPKVPWVDRVNVFFKYRRYVKMLARRWPLLFLACAIGTLIMGWKAYTTPNIYQASSKIGVAPKINKPYTTGVQMVEELNYFYENQVALMGSRDVLLRTEQAMQQKGYTNPPALLEPVAGKDKGNLTMDVRSTDFDYARNYSIQWAHAFLDFKADQREGLIGKSARTTRDEVVKYEKRLQQARNDITKFQREHNLASVKEVGDALQKQYDDRYKEYQDIITLRQRLENKSKEDLADGGIGEKIVAARDGEKKAAPMIVESVDPLAKYLEGSSYSKLKYELRQKEADRDRLSLTLKPRHPFMAKLNDDIARLQDDIRYELEEIDSKRLARIKSLKIDEDALKPVLEDLQKKLFDSRQVQTEFSKLQEEETNNKQVLERLNRQLQEIELTPADESQFNVLEEGAGTPHPVQPNRVRMILTGLLAGLLVGLGLIYFLDRLDDRLELAEEIEGALQEPILGQLPSVPKSEGGGSLLVTKLDEHNMFSEALRGVRSAVLLGFGNERKKVLLVTSAVPGDGKTTFTTNFAITLAIAGHRVLLVDADLRRGATHTFFGNSREPGFSDVLMGEKHWTDVIRQTSIETLKVIHSGPLPSNPGELLISPIPEQLIEEAREEFEFVIFDCPPLTAIDDTFSLMPFSDGVLFVVRSGQTSMRFAKNSLHAIRQRGAQILGLVLNGIAADNPHYYYQQYYHAYYTREAKNAAAGSVMPVRRMAKPSKERAQSISELAKAYSGDNPELPLDDASTKAAQYKARRMAKASSASPKENAPDV